MASNTSMNRSGNVHPLTKDVSKLIAVPNTPLKSRPSPATPLSVSLPMSASSSGSISHQGPPSNTRSTTPNTTKSSKHADNEAFKATSESVKWEYDVYAAPFIPLALRSINKERACVIATRPKHWIDYQAHIQKFVGSSYVTEQTLDTLNEESELATPPPGKPLTEEFYLHYFDALMSIERAAKERDLETHALYQVPLYRIYTPDGEVWALLVPGLREDCPLMEMGDTLQLRQLWTDAVGNLVHMPMHKNSDHFLNPVVYFRCWTGVQYDASVYSINRAQETVFLKVEGLDFLSLGPSLVPMSVNVIFPLNSGLLEEQRRALVSTNAELRQATCPLHQDGSTVGKRVCAPHNDWTRRILFPTEADGLLQTQLRKIPHRALFDHAINYEQAHAVNDVCGNDYGTVPYLIVGPPGTGKTKTLVETTMQLLNSTKIAHMIICAPSEAAADTLALRLKHYLNNKELLRLNRPGRADNEMPGELAQYCYIENDMYYLPPFQMLLSFNVVVTSCRDAAILAEARLTNKDLWTMEKNMFSVIHPEDQVPTPSLHWGALLIDEAAQATEIDVLPAISIVLPPSAYPSHLPQPRFVMAGDENQLGPQTASRNPQFSTSLFARLFDRPLYKDHPLSRSNTKPRSGPPVLKRSMLPIIYPPFTLLVRNYRSHPAILSVPSSLFYSDTLIPEAQTPTTGLQSSSLWRGRKWPILYLPHTGADEIERDGGGWYNMSEAVMACSVAQRLVIESQVQQSDICIMSPFAAQVKLLRTLIRSNAYGGGSGLWNVNIGPLEAFQGSENRVVIICTTRTRERFLEMDAKRGLGIVHQKRKMNVALTRAKEALFVIGNTAVLRADEHWRQWLAFCWRNGLVSDDGRMWNREKKTYEKEIIGVNEKEITGVNEKEITGVLERALVAKEKGSKTSARVLGLASSDLRMHDEYEAWVESLREALDDEEGGQDKLEDEDDAAEGGSAEGDQYTEEGDDDEVA